MEYGTSKDYIIGHPEREEKGAEILFEGIVAENIPNLGKKIDLQIKKPRVFQIRGTQ